MKRLLTFLIIGFAAQLIDGALGMAYGTTTTSLLLTFGVAPVIASTSVHIAEIFTTGVSSLSHIKFGNVDRRLVLHLMIPGAVGGFIGAFFLSSLPSNLIRPYIAIFLLIIGIYILMRYLFKTKKINKKVKSFSGKQINILGLFAGFIDAVGGGGWGPVATPILLTKGGIPPRKVVGSVDTSEFIVALSSSAGFIFVLGFDNINWMWVFTLMIGGMAAAPLAAWLVKILPTQILGVGISGLIITTNIRTLFQTWKVSEPWVMMTYLIIFILWGFSIMYSYHQFTKNK